MGMTWKFKVQRVAFALVIVAGLAMASGANWYGGVAGLLGGVFGLQLDYYW
jgi:hypothetical protein